ncbi:MAG: Hsp70 family protein, partial [Fuerstiella sp.]|nr:Hsp70 family protein [Fuerstiella sp.]
TSIIEEFIAEKDGQPLNLSCTIDRETLHELIQPMVERTIDCVGRALRDASLTIHQVDDLVLVGGSTRLALVEEALRREFLRESSRAVDPDLAVALGAAVQGAMLQGQNVGPVLVDVTSHTLGIEACEGMSFAGPELVFDPIIHRNSPLPARYEQAYSTMHDEQETAEIHVLQGEYDDIERNQSIGKFKLNLQQGDGKHRKIVVRFDLTLDGMLKVTATQPASGVSNELTIENALSQFVASQRDRVQARLGELFEASSELIDQNDLPLQSEFHDNISIDGAHDTVGESKLATIARVKEQYPEAVGLLEKAEALRPNVQGDDAADLETISNGLMHALESGDESRIASLSTELDDV